MIRIDDRTVELSEAEAMVSEWFEELLDNGRCIPSAIKSIKAAAAFWGCNNEAREIVGLPVQTDEIGREIRTVVRDPEFMAWLAG